MQGITPKYLLHVPSHFLLESGMSTQHSSSSLYHMHVSSGRFNLPFIGEEFKEITCPNKNKQTFKFIVIEVEGTAKLNDWEFVASIDHFKNGNVIRKAITNLEIPDKYRYGDSYCEHCNTKRSRKNTYIVHNIKTNEFKQVGKSCLKDFTRGMSIEQVTFMLSLRDLFEEAEEQVYSPSFSSNKFYFNTREILKYGAETVRLFGYVKSKYEDGTENLESTKNRTLDFGDMNLETCCQNMIRKRLRSSKKKLTLILILLKLKN